MANTLTLAPETAATPDLHRGSVFFVGTATVILRYAGFTILTDPNFLHAGDHVHLGYGLHSTRSRRGRRSRSRKARRGAS